MNDKEEFIFKIVDSVIESCRYKSASKPITRESILSEERISENHVMTRCILVRQLKSIGYTTESIADLLNRKETTIRDMLTKNDDYERVNVVYRIASSNATKKCREVISENSM